MFRAIPEGVRGLSRYPLMRCPGAYPTTKARAREPWVLQLGLGMKTLLWMCGLSFSGLLGIVVGRYFGIGEAPGFFWALSLFGLVRVVVGKLARLRRANLLVES
jgi:hypothetical protein